MAEEGAFNIARKTLYWTISLVILTIMAAGLAIMIIQYRSALVLYPPKLESEIISERFINSPNCFAYQDPFTDRVYPSLVDIDKFTDNILRECYFSNTTEDYHFRFLLKDLDSNESYESKTSNWFNVPAFTLTRPVRIKDEEEISTGKLLIYVQKPTK